ncbi:hypothetical protein DRQ25_11370 [Candidatus Fermentibacteria bacterium]|nr:MAG: hypothetical protein DRQ25_11370 [Candidatus Fermentibacteria bacterium]
MKDKAPVIVCLLLITLLSTPVTASIPSLLESLGLVPVEDSGEEAQLEIASIPAMEELPGIRFSALVIDLQTGNPVARSGAGEFSLNIPEIFILASSINVMPEDSLVPVIPAESESVPSCTAADVAIALQVIHSGMETPEVIELLEKPDMGDGQASSIAEGWDLYGWVDSGVDHKTFILIAISPEGRELGFILLSDDLCCEEKGDLAMMLLWQAASQL